VLRNSGREFSEIRSRTGSPRFHKIVRVLLFLAAALTCAPPGFAQHYYAKVDRFAKIDDYSKVNTNGGSLANFKKLPVPPLASKCSRNNGSLCSTSNSAVTVAKTAKADHELDQMAKQSASSLKSAANHQSSKGAATHKLPPAARSASGSGINAPSAGSRRIGASSSATNAKRRR
jgi:hypothetical protein